MNAIPETQCQAKTRIELFWTHSALHIHRQLQQLGTLRKLPPGTGGCKEALALDEMLQNRWCKQIQSNFIHMLKFWFMGSILWRLVHSPKFYYTVLRL